MASLKLPVTHARSSEGWGGHSLLAFEEAATVLDLESWIVQRLRHPVEESTAYLQLLRDSGDSVCVPVFHVLHSEMSGCSIGSLSLVPDLQLRDCQAVAMERTWQGALLGLPLGGAAYGLVCDPLDLSERELTAIGGPLARRLNSKRATQSYVFPGRGCRREFMARLFSELRGPHSVTVTGKPDCLAGLDPDQFTAEGIAALASAALHQAGKASVGARVAVQGFGSLGQAISHRLAREGMKVVAITDNSGGIYRPDGLILDDISTRFAHEQVLFGYPEAEHITRAELPHVPSDLLVLASGPNELQDRNCNGVAAGLIIEAEWSAVSETAKARLISDGVVVAPWLLATVGTLIGSYLEAHTIQILSNVEELLAKCYGVVGQAVEQVLRRCTCGESSCEQAAYRYAIERAANYIRGCGTEG